MTGYLLGIRNLTLTNIEKDPWFKNPSYMSRFVTCFNKVGWMKYFHFLKAGDRVPQALTSRKEFLIHTQSWGDYNLYLLNQSHLPMEAKGQPFAASFYPHYRAVDFILAFNSTFERISSDVTVNKVSQFVCCLHHEFSSDALFGPEVRLRSFDPYPRLWPPRYVDYLTYGNLIDFFSYKYFKQEYKTQEETERIFNAAVPDIVESRWCSDDLRVIQWVNNLQDEEHSLERRALQEKWLVNLVNPPVDPNFTHLFNNEIKEEDPYLTYYQKLVYNNGYKMLDVGSDGSFDRELVSQLVKWKEEKQLPDGRKLREVFLIVPTLEAALEIYTQVLEMGVDNVFYME